MPAKIQYLQRYLTLFSTSSPQLEDVEVGHWGGRFHVHRCSTFEMAWRKLCIWTTFEIVVHMQKAYIYKGISPYFRNCSLNSKRLRLGIAAEGLIWNFATFNLYFVPAKILYLQRYLTLFSTSLPQLEDVEVGHWGGRFHVRRWSTFEMAWRKLCIWTTFEIVVHMQKAYISKGI